MTGDLCKNYTITICKNILYNYFGKMRVRAVERRCRQRGNRSPTLRIETDYHMDCMPQYFQVTVNVLEARKLNWSNPRTPNSYVIVVLGKKKHRTGMRRNMEEPHYREYFVFDLCMSLKDIQRSSVWLAVMEPKCCAPPKLLGETTIDLGAIWAQPHHQVYHKWAQLSVPRDPIAGCVGFLKVDISIILRGEVQIMPPTAVSSQKLEDNLLVLSGSEQQRANYQITIYGGFGLPYGSQPHGHRRFGKPPSTFVRVSFCGLIAKTGVQPRTNNPKYNEQISIVEMFPNMNQTILIEVCSGDGVFNKTLASTDLRLGQISHDGENGFLPTFGPSLLHMYSSSNALGNGTEDGPYHRGSLLLALKTLVPYYQQTMRGVTVEPVCPIDLNKLWTMEDFCTYCPIFEVSMLDKRLISQQCGVAISIGEISSDRPMDEEFWCFMEEIKSRKLHYTGSLEVDSCSEPYGNVDFPHAFPVLQLITRLPDFRFRMYWDNMILGLLSDLEHVVENVERRLQTFQYNCTSELVNELNKVLDDTSGNIMKFLDITSHSATDDAFCKFNTDLDIKQQTVQREEIEYISHKILNRTKSSPRNPCANTSKTMTSRKGVKFLLAVSKNFAQNLKNVMRKTSNGWPDLVIWLLNNGSRVAYYKIPAADVIYSVISEQCGKYCGQIQTIYLKPLKCPTHINTTATTCFCIAGKIELQLWTGLYRQKCAFEQCLPTGYRLKVKEFDMCVKAPSHMVELRAFIYRAKLCNLAENCNIDCPFVRVNVINSVKETKRLRHTSTPVWNQLLRIQRLVFTTIERLTQSPPTVLVEVYDGDLETKTDLIGQVQVEPVVDDRYSYDHAPSLQWYDLYRGAEFAGKIMMSLQILPVQETFLKSTMYSSCEENCYGSVQKCSESMREDAEDSLPPNLIPKTSCYKVDVYWWGLRHVNITKKPCVVLEIDELCIKSDVIADKKSSSNFPNGRTSQTFESPLSEVCSPPLNIRLYDSSTFGRTLFLGTNVVKNPNKFLVNWMPKIEREASLKSASMKSFAFVQVATNQVMIKRNKDNCLTETSDRSSVSIRSCFTPKPKVKRSNWKTLFSRNGPSEEEYTLLPVSGKVPAQKVPRPKLPYQKVRIGNTTDEKVDWWLRFTRSEMFQENSEREVKKSAPDGIKIYDSELELQPEFNKFKDWCSTLKLYNGMKTGIPEKDGQLQCGFLKAGIAIYRWPPPENTVAVSVNGVDLSKGFFCDHPNNEPTKFLVRVYVVRALNLKAKDFTGKSDPYIVLSCGRKHLGDRNNYVANSVDPIFGRMFEFRSTLPEDYTLTISLYDYDAIPPDELIGSTSIDLEDRIYTKHRARVGLPLEYKLHGSSRWRDSKTPSTILQEICFANHLPPPVFLESNTVLINNVEYIDKLKDNKIYHLTPAEQKENICLNLLKNWHTMPLCGYHLVPEHVETRSLYNPDKQGLEQGKIQLWIDIFPLDANEVVSVTAPLDIDPRKTEEYELRIIIWTAQIDMSACTIAPGKISKSLDLVVKTWIGSPENAQYTDVHRNTENGIGKFNWRMIFHIDYMHSRKMLVEKEQGPFTEYHEYSQPHFTCQILESSSGEVLGSMALNLNSMPRGSKNLEDSEASVDQSKINLFSVNTIRGWWPVININAKSPCVGLIDVQLDLLPLDQAKGSPVGFGRDPPFPIAVPLRRVKAKTNILKSVLCKCGAAIDTCPHVKLLATGILIFAIGCVFYLLLQHMELFLSVSGHRGHHRHNEGIIRTLYPIRA